MYKLCRKLHNWLGLILALQILLWFLSGLIMSVLPIEEVRGEHLKKHISANWSDAAVSPADVLSDYPGETPLRLSSRLLLTNGLLTAEPVYSVRSNDRNVNVSAITGETLAPLTATTVSALAMAQYTGPGTAVSVQLLDALPQEVHALTPPLWQVQMDDAQNSRFYLDPDTGMVTRVRTDNWRLFDFFWMLHIMDYDERSDINNPLLISFSASALLFTLTGLVLLWQRYRPRRRRFTRRARHA
ncbi:PepSY domain-containing protein [Alteromonas sp. CYL-A6]|uniref:PepSY domain-containing protein n=1 Tax=Alteromonas nitratireducens TaxID=3390813 RepID=UPI0034B4BFF0